MLKLKVCWFLGHAVRLGRLGLGGTAYREGTTNRHRPFYHRYPSHPNLFCVVNITVRSLEVIDNSTGIGRVIGGARRYTNIVVK